MSRKAKSNITEKDIGGYYLTENGNVLVLKSVERIPARVVATFIDAKADRLTNGELSDFSGLRRMVVVPLPHKRVRKPKVQTQSAVQPASTEPSRSSPAPETEREAQQRRDQAYELTETGKIVAKALTKRSRQSRKEKPETLRGLATFQITVASDKDEFYYARMDNGVGRGKTLIEAIQNRFKMFLTVYQPSDIKAWAELQPESEGKKLLLACLSGKEKGEGK